MSKQIVRKKYLIDRKSKFKPISVKYDLLIKALKNFNFLKNKKFGGYYPINYEIDCFEILKKLEKAGYKISLPVTKNKNEMDFFEWSFNDPLHLGKMGVPEPCQNKQVHPDILLVPLVAFDKTLVYREEK